MRADKGISEYLGGGEPWKRMREFNQLEGPSQLTFPSVCGMGTLPKVRVPKPEMSPTLSFDMLSASG